MDMSAARQMADRVAELMEERLGLAGADLQAKLRRGRGLLPNTVRRQAALLATAAEKAANPKLIGQIDLGAVTDAYDVCVAHLTAIDPARRRRSYLWDVVAFVGFGVLALAAAVLFAVAVWGLL